MSEASPPEHSSFPLRAIVSWDLARKQNNHIIVPVKKSVTSFYADSHIEIVIDTLNASFKDLLISKYSDITISGTCSLDGDSGMLHYKLSKLISCSTPTTPSEIVELELLKDRHKEFLQQHGIPYKGSRSATSARKIRTAHCYNCYSALDNSVDEECLTCGWIICTCGACGCGYTSKA